MPELNLKSAISFANQLREARLAALADAEAYGGIVHAIERLGSYLSPPKLNRDKKHVAGSLGYYETKLIELSTKSTMANLSTRFPGLLTDFSRLYKLVEWGRNDAMHQGAVARHLTVRAVELAIILEDALAIYKLTAEHFMVANPICAEGWQPVGFVRQQMLANSFSHLPILGADQEWHVVSDIAVAKFLTADRTGPIRINKLATSLVESNLPTPAELVGPEDELDSVLERLVNHPVLLVTQAPPEKNKPQRLLGILTAFDLL